jgi:2-oxoglutarate ferredoxin oxidoreductase subunit alpha
MASDVNIMIGGEAGQGIQSVGSVLARALGKWGFNVFADQDYESRVRGGHNFFRVRAGNRDAMAPTERLDVLVALNDDTVERHVGEVKDAGVIVREGRGGETRRGTLAELSVPLANLAQEVGGGKVMGNSVAAGAALGLLNCDFAILADVLRKEFARLAKETAEGNVRAAKAGYDFAQRSRVRGPRVTPRGGAAKAGRMLISGNHALAVGALAGGCRFIAGYPMTPSTAILEYMAAKSKAFDIVAMHVEDEISAINMAVGAAYAGVRSMTATSGGGFSLMVEGLALAGMTETPVVIVLGQRPGPATGLPTRTEQGELNFALHAGHGEFPRAVLAPATVSEAFHAAVKAFNLAERYQTPAIILSDHHLATSSATVDRFDLSRVRIDRGELFSEEESRNVRDYARHRVTRSGVSPRALPWQSTALTVTDSDEHGEAGHMIEDAANRNSQHEKRLRKAIGLRKEIARPRFHRARNAELTLIGWGSSYGAIREAAQLLRKDGIAANVLHLSEIWPFPTDPVAKALRNDAKAIAIESNATGQMAGLIRRETGHKIAGHVLRYDGRPLTAGYILRHLKKEVS